MTEYNEYRVKIEGFLIVTEENEEAAEKEVAMCLPGGFNFRVTKVTERKTPTKVKII